MTPWRWWVGHDDDGQPEIYAIDECDSRDDAIEAGLRATKPGEQFHIVEARSSEDRRYEGADSAPFLRTRNHEIVTNGPATPQGDGE